MQFTDHEILDETLRAPKGSLILSSDSYLIENPSWYQVVSPSRRDASRNEVIFSSLKSEEADGKIEGWSLDEGLRPQLLEDGMIIIKSESLEEAKKIAHSDPFVKSGVRTCEVRSWQLSCQQNNHLGMG